MGDDYLPQAFQVQDLAEHVQCWHAGTDRLCAFAWFSAHQGLPRPAPGLSSPLLFILRHISKSRIVFRHSVRGEPPMRTMLLIAAMLGPKNFCRFCLLLVVAGGFLFYCVTR